jgi:hypothetical protein
VIELHGRYNRAIPTMRRLSAVVLVLTLAASPLAGRQATDSEAVARWASAAVVHYKMVGVYEGETVIAYGEPAGTATVTDRVELELDWSIKDATIAGEPTIVNGTSETRDLRNIDRSCPPPVPATPYEHFTVATVAAVNGALQLKGTREFPVVRVVSGCMAVQEPRTVRAWQQEVSERLLVPSPLLLAAPPGADANLTVAADKASFTIKTGAWRWTFTPTLVR